MSDGRASRAPARTACDVADIERSGPSKNQHLTESLTAAVGGPTPCACGSITIAHVDHGIRVTPPPRIADLRIVVEAPVRRAV
jgi:hypothetical protein